MPFASLAGAGATLAAAPHTWSALRRIDPRVDGLPPVEVGTQDIDHDGATVNETADDIGRFEGYADDGGLPPPRAAHEISTISRTARSVFAEVGGVRCRSGTRLDRSAARLSGVHGVTGVRA